MGIKENTPNTRLRRARHRRGWTQAQLAEMLETDFETVSRWERGITVPSFFYQRKLCDVFGMTPEELGLLVCLDDEPAGNPPPVRSSSIFLAISSADSGHPVVVALSAELEARGFLITSSRASRRLDIGERRKWLQETIRATQLVLLIVSPDAPTSRHVQEALQIAKIYQRCLCALWVAGECWQTCLPKDGGEISTTLDARQGYNETHLTQIRAMLEQTKDAASETSGSLSSSNELPEPRNPYKGLHAFRPEDHDDFFGRDRLIDVLTTTLETALRPDQQHEKISRLLAIIGPSGSGKSSVLLAGLLPRLQAGGIPGSEKWIYVEPIVPGMHPIESLALALVKHWPDRSQNSIQEALEDDSTLGLDRLAATLAQQQETNVVLCIDQFEEVFTQTLCEQERQHFIDLLVAAVTRPRGPLIVLLTLRADFSDRPMCYPDFCYVLEAHRTLVLPMDMQELRSSIECPAALPDVQLTFQDGLVRELLFEMRGQAGVLPLLQFTLDQLFLRCNGRQLTWQAYQELGGISGALSQFAEKTYASLPSDEHRQMARRLFLRLIDPGLTDQDVTRRRAALSEFSLESPLQTRLMQETLHAFIEARLLTIQQTDTVTTIEVSHEALLREWQRLTRWIQQAQWDVCLQQNIGKDVAAWEQSGKSGERLYRGAQLMEASAWAKRTVPSQRELAFLRASATRQRHRRVAALSIACLIGLLLVPLSFVLASFFGLSTPFNTRTVPGGMWITPADGQRVHGTLHLAAFAYPGALGAPAVAYVDFTMEWVGSYKWLTGCHLTRPTHGDVFQCEVNLQQQEQIALADTVNMRFDTVNVSFNVYDVLHNVNKAPNGVRTVIASP